MGMAGAEPGPMLNAHEWFEEKRYGLPFRGRDRHRDGDRKLDGPIDPDPDGDGDPDDHSVSSRHGSIINFSYHEGDQAHEDFKK